MSVVNEMLRDLQERQESVKQLPLKASVSRERSISSLIYVPLIILVIYLLLSLKRDDTRNTSDEQGYVTSTNTLETGEIKDAVQVNTEKVSFEKAEIKSVEKNELPNIKNDEPTLLVIDDLNIVATENVNETPKTNRVSTQNIASDHKEKSLLKEDKAIEEKIIVKKQSPASVLNNRLLDIKNSYSNVGLNKTKKSLLELLVDEPKFHQARIYLIKILWKRNTDSLEKILERAVTDYPNQSAYLLAAARYHLEKNNLTKAENILLKIQILVRLLKKLMLIIYFI